MTVIGPRFERCYAGVSHDFVREPDGTFVSLCGDKRLVTVGINNPAGRKGCMIGCGKCMKKDFERGFEAVEEELERTDEGIRLWGSKTLRRSREE